MLPVYAMQILLISHGTVENLEATSAGNFFQGILCNVAQKVLGTLLPILGAFSGPTLEPKFLGVFPGDFQKF